MGGLHIAGIDHAHFARTSDIVQSEVIRCADASDKQRLVIGSLAAIRIPERSSMTTRRPLPRTPRLLQAIPGRSVADEQTIAMILALTSELAIVRARLDACERLLVEEKVLNHSAIDSFSPDAAAQTARELQRTRLIAKILRPLTETAGCERDALPTGETA